MSEDSVGSDDGTRGGEQIDHTSPKMRFSDSTEEDSDEADSDEEQVTFADRQASDTEAVEADELVDEIEEAVSPDDLEESGESTPSSSDLDRSSTSSGPSGQVRHRPAGRPNQPKLVPRLGVTPARCPGASTWRPTD